MISDFLFLGTGLKTKTRKSLKIFIFFVFSSKLYRMRFVYLFLYYVVVDNAVTLFNSFFCDFRCFRAFDLADIYVVRKAGFLTIRAKYILLEV